MFSVSLLTAQQHELLLTANGVSNGNTTAPFAAGPGVVLALILLVALLYWGLTSAIGAIWALLKPLLILLGTLALMLAAVLLLTGTIVEGDLHRAAASYGSVEVK